MERIGSVSVVLFESDRDEEALKIEAVLTDGDELHVLQESDGPLTLWAFEETPHRIEVVFPQDGTRSLAGYFCLDSLRQLPEMMRVAFTGYDAGVRIRELARRLGVAYEVRESVVKR